MRTPQLEAANGFDPLSRFDDCLIRQFGLCQALENLADSLPWRVDTLAATILANRLHPTLRQCHRMEETIIFPVLLISGPQMHPILDRLRKEHVEDEDHASDVRDAVTAFASNQARADAEEIGYMLRCLFVSLRRHLAFDRDYVLPLYRQTCDL